MAPIDSNQCRLLTEEGSLATVRLCSKHYAGLLCHLPSSTRLSDFQLWMGLAKIRAAAQFEE